MLPICGVSSLELVFHHSNMSSLVVKLEMSIFLSFYLSSSPICLLFISLSSLSSSHFHSSQIDHRYIYQYEYQYDRMHQINIGSSSIKGILTIFSTWHKIFKIHPQISLGTQIPHHPQIVPYDVYV